MAITALPTPPSRSDPATFAARGDAFMTALPTFATEANVLQTDVNAKQAAAAVSANAAQADRILCDAAAAEPRLDRRDVAAQRVLLLLTEAGHGALGAGPELAELGGILEALLRDVAGDVAPGQRHAHRQGLAAGRGRAINWGNDDRTLIVAAFGNQPK